MVDPWPFFGEQDHPGYGLTPERVNRIFRESEAGDLRELADLYDDLIESDGHLRAQFESRISAVSGKGITIQPGGTTDTDKAAAEILEQALLHSDLDFIVHLEHHLEAAFKGWSATEIVWGLRAHAGRLAWVPVELDDIEHRRFLFRARGGSERNELLLATRTIERGESLLPGQWVISKARHSNLARSGLFRTCAWWCLFKRLSVRDWIVFAEIFGIPLLVGYYEQGATPEAKEALEIGLRDIGEGGRAILSDLTKIAISDIPQRSGDGGGVHERIVARCDAEISKLISGATLNVESGGPGSFALGRVHQDRSFDLQVADAARLQRTWHRFIARPFMRFNGFEEMGAKTPKLNIQVAHTLDPKTRTDILDTLGENGIHVDGWHVAEQMGFRRPQSLDDATKPKTTPGAKPGAKREEQAA